MTSTNRTQPKKRYRTAKEVKGKPLISDKDLDNREVVDQVLDEFLAKHQSVLQSLAKL